MIDTPQAPPLTATAGHVASPPAIMTFPADALVLDAEVNRVGTNRLSVTFTPHAGTSTNFSVQNGVIDPGDDRGPYAVFVLLTGSLVGDGTVSFPTDIRKTFVTDTCQDPQATTTDPCAKPGQFQPWQFPDLNTRSSSVSAAQLMFTYGNHKSYKIKNGQNQTDCIPIFNFPPFYSCKGTPFDRLRLQVNDTATDGGLNSTLNGGVFKNKDGQQNSVIEALFFGFGAGVLFVLGLHGLGAFFRRWRR